MKILEIAIAATLALLPIHAAKADYYLSDYLGDAESKEKDVQRHIYIAGILDGLYYANDFSINVAHQAPIFCLKNRPAVSIQAFKALIDAEIANPSVAKQKYPAAMPVALIGLFAIRATFPCD